MPRGACVVERRGKRATTISLKYVDAAGQQVWERLGTASEGWTKRKAEAELRDRLVRVEKRRWRRPAPLTFAEYAERWFGEGPDRRGWSAGTIAEYRSVRRRLEAQLGHLPLAGIRARHVAELVAAMRRPAKGRPNGYSPATVTRDLGVLSAMFESALREELAENNPARRAERPKVPRRRWRILKPAEVAAVERAFGELATEAEAPKRARLRVYRVAFLALIVTGLRRHELEGLCWRHVDLIDNVLRVERSKSEAGERSIAIPPRLAEELWQHRRRTAYQGEDEYVFASPDRGAQLNADAYMEAFRDALKRAGVDGYVRPFHDARHASLTLGAATGEGAIALMTRAGHANMTTTKQYLHLAGTVFRAEAERLEERLLGPSRIGTCNGPPAADAESGAEAGEACYPDCYPTELTSADAAEPDRAPQAG